MYLARRKTNCNPLDIIIIENISSIMFIFSLIHQSTPVGGGGMGARGGAGFGELEALR